MKTQLLIATFITISFTACTEHRSTKQWNLNETIHWDKEVQSTTTTLAWIDSLLYQFVTSSSNPVVTKANEQGTQIAWLFDQKLLTDTATYFIFQIGNDVEDEDGDNRRFITQQWVYVDSTSRQLYEYDVTNETLRIWKP